MKKMKNENQPRTSTQKCEETSSFDEKACQKKKTQLKKANENLHSLTTI